MNTHRCFVAHVKDGQQRYLHDIPCGREDLGNFNMGQVMLSVKIQDRLHQVKCNLPQKQSHPLIPPEIDSGFLDVVTPPAEKLANDPPEGFKVEENHWLGLLKNFGHTENLAVTDLGQDGKAVCIARESAKHHDAPHQAFNSNKSAEIDLTVPPADPVYQPGIERASRRPTRPPWRLKQPTHVHITAPRRLGRSVAVRAG